MCEITNPVTNEQRNRTVGTGEWCGIKRGEFAERKRESRNRRGNGNVKCEIVRINNNERNEQKRT